MKNIFIVIMLSCIFICCKNKTKKQVVRQLTEKQVSTRGYVLQGHELDSLNAIRRSNDPTSPIIISVEVDTINHTSTWCWNESINGTLVRNCITNF